MTTQIMATCLFSSFGGYKGGGGSIFC